MFQNLYNYYSILVGVIGLIFIIVNYILIENNKMDENNGKDYLEKIEPFECGFNSFEQSNNPIPVPFILIALLFLPFDLEVASLLPYIISIYYIDIYGLIIFLFFLFILVIGFIYEFNTKSLILFKYSKNKTPSLLKEIYFL